MAVQPFFRPRKPRIFNHHYIYFDSEKEARERRYERLRNELIDKGELSGEKTYSFASEPSPSSYDGSRLKGRFAKQTQHLNKELEDGVTRHERRIKMIKLMLLILALSFVLWYIFYSY